MPARTSYEGPSMYQTPTGFQAKIQAAAADQQHNNSLCCCSIQCTCTRHLRCCISRSRCHVELCLNVFQLMFLSTHLIHTQLCMLQATYTQQQRPMLCFSNTQSGQYAEHVPTFMPACCNNTHTKHTLYTCRSNASMYAVTQNNTNNLR